MTSDIKMFEMLAYETSHMIDEAPWRCMRCERLTHHADADIHLHLTAAHNIPSNRIIKEKQGLFILLREEDKEVTV